VGGTKRPLPPKQSMNNEAIINNAVDEIVKEAPNSVEDPRALVERVTNRFIKDKINDFPRMCQVAGVMNAEKQRELQEVGRKGKYTDSYGWSEDGSILADYDIPQELYNFMNVFVYKDFWSSDNESVWRPFMSKVCKGMTNYDAMQLFVKLKRFFGDTNLVKVR
jgi:hypothetical protein